MKTPWVVVDFLKQEMRCNNCGDTHPMSALNGKLVKVAVRFMNAFVALHKNCKEKK